MDMRSSFVFIVALLLFPAQTGSAFAAPQTDPDALVVQVMSFNIRHGDAADGDNHWERRKSLLYEVIRSQTPDFIGLQEALRFQLEEMASALPGYRWVGEGRDGGSGGEHSAIFYRADRFALDRTATFWLSDTPGRPSSHWGNACVRICTWARFRQRKSGRGLYLYNTHLDHVSQPSREQSVRLIVKHMQAQKPVLPVVLTGDFNAGEDNPAIAFLTGRTGDNPFPLRDSFRQLHAGDTDVATFNGFGVEPADGQKIDYIFCPADVRVLDAAIVRCRPSGRYPSDHYPLTARLEFPGGRD